jgi:hypothetical protein
MSDERECSAEYFETSAWTEQQLQPPIPSVAWCMGETADEWRQRISEYLDKNLWFITDGDTKSIGG